MESMLQAPKRRPSPVAAPWHTISLLVVFAWLSFRELLSRQASPPAELNPGASHGALVSNYLWIIALEIGLAAWIWAGVHWQGLSLRDLIGGRWTSWRSVARDIAIAIPFWLVWEATAWLMNRVVAPLHAAGGTYHNPEGFTEASLWIVVSILAGFCEELTYRGYLQRQFHALTNNLPAAIVLQGIVFGLEHSYQGWGKVVVISVLGILYGIFVAWRGDLRASMITHAWSDVFEGYLRSIWLPNL